MWLRAICLLVTAILGCQSYSIAVIYPDRSSDYFRPYADEAADTFEQRSGGSAQVMLLKRPFNSITLCSMLHGTVENLMERSSSLYIFIIAPEIRPIDCYDQWGAMFSNSLTSRVLLVTPDPQHPNASEKKDFWWMNGQKFRTATWVEMADSIAEIYNKQEQTITYESITTRPWEDYAAEVSADIPDLEELFSNFPMATIRAARTSQSTTLSPREVQSKKFDDEMEDRRQRRRIGMLLIGCGAVCTMAIAFYIRNRFCKPVEKAEENDDKMEKAAENDAKTAKNWTAKKKSEK